MTARAIVASAIVRSPAPSSSSRDRQRHRAAPSTTTARAVSRRELGLTLLGTTLGTLVGESNARDARAMRCAHRTPTATRERAIRGVESSKVSHVD